MSDTVLAKVHGAISLVNAIANNKGATLGIKLLTEATVKKSPGHGIVVCPSGGSMSEKLVIKTVQKSISKANLKSHKIQVSIDTQIPLGYGLKSSSSVSTAVALACMRLFSKKIDDSEVIKAGVDASIQTGVSITGAYDDACACYYGGFCVTNNKTKKIMHSSRAPYNLYAIVYIPYKRARGNPKHLRESSEVFSRAWDMAQDGDYWNAMIINGVAASATLKTDPKIIGELVKAGALGASVSGNGPAIAAVVKKQNIAKVKKCFSKSDGKVITVAVNCKKASAYAL